MLITCTSPENDLVHGVFSRNDMQPHIHGNPSLSLLFVYLVLLVAQFEYEAQLWLPVIIASALCELSKSVAPDEYLAQIKYYQAENCRFQDM